MTIDQTAQARAWLERDPLRQIVLLKHLQIYAGRITCHYHERDQHAGVLLLLPVAESSWDAYHYQHCQMVALFNTDHPSIAEQLLDQIPAEVMVVFKIGHPVAAAAAKRRFALERVTAFISLTSEQPRFAADPAVQVHTRIDPHVLVLFAAEGHDPAWLTDLLAQEQGLICTIADGDQIVSACFAVAIAPGIWEIGGLWTHPSQRRRGLARRVTITALDQLAKRGLRPRYQVHETNHASLQLAESVGLVPFVITEHYLGRTV